MQKLFYYALEKYNYLLPCVLYFQDRLLEGNQTEIWSRHDVFD